MGSGFSTASAGDTSAPLPPCPLFYNFMPDNQLIPASTLPMRGPGGTVRRPQGGCAARVIPLCSLPVVSEKSRKDAKKIVADAKRNKKRGSDSTAEEVEARAVAAANALLRNPSLLPSLSSCFLLNIAVDEQGRLVPLLTNDEYAVNTMAGFNDTGAGGPGSSCWNPLKSPRSSFLKKGFNFSTTNSPVRTPMLPGAASDRGDSLTSGAERSSQGGENGAAANQLVSTLLPSTTAAVNAVGRSAGAAPPPDPPSPQCSKRQPKRRSRTKKGGGDGAQPALSKAPEKLISTFAIAPAPSSSVGPARIVCDTTADDEQDVSLATPSVCSVLVKDSHFRKSEDGQGGASASVAPALWNGGVSGVDSVSPQRMRRQLSRITLLRVSERTRWLLFNDSGTHEAQVSVLLCYRAQKEKSTSPMKPIAGEEAPMKPSGRTETASTPAPGDLRVLCCPRPLSHTSLSTNKKELQSQGTSSSSRSYVEVRPVLVEAFTAAIPAPTTPVEEHQLAEFKKNVAGAAAVEVFVVLAPGATVYLAEGDVLGYRLDTLLVPFDASRSMAVLGSMLTPKMVCRLKKKSKAASKKGYRHTLMFLAKAAAPAVGAAPAPRSGPAVARLTGSAMATLPKAATSGAPKHTHIIPPLSADTLNAAPPDLKQSTLFEAPAEALIDATRRADDAEATTSATPPQHPPPSSLPAPETAAKGEAAAAAAAGEIGAQRRLSLRSHRGKEEESGNRENQCVGAAANPYSFGAPATVPSTAAAASQSLGCGAADAAPEAAATLPAWSAADAKAARAGYMSSAAGVPVLDLKSLAASSDKDRSAPRGDASVESSEWKSTGTQPLDIAF
ncbi:hypothetical protein, unknown function [Leishmania infantum JPCM5]|uniref:Uncharacterized protein n=2 Tax=Leishmania infantum TaxID=5671 RepID=A4HYW9_LEIIN|nr:hypothetical protein, unknown function [Leishmania infantum JPCM5]CAC9484662.1 hypothetical_protein_-_conserved [Leishmania infantum]CAM67508.1 hypothetical protein, unknown function [Leishmania infantum JPCM5]SUZ41406.1 hypothetical_protein_-_conserved [Leishmania infantum]|eukprot:XP_001465260.1 hypothetical protein, unknown function [Leishmania infantum JPCM5]